MTDTLTRYIESAGTAGIGILWLPVLIWLVVVAVVMVLLRTTSRIDALYHYHIRAALVLGLPAGIAINQLLKFLADLFQNTAVPVPPAIWLIEAPSAVPAVTAAAEASVIDWWSFLPGVLLVIFAPVSLFLLIRLTVGAFSLSRLRRNGSKATSGLFRQLDPATRNLYNSLKIKPLLVINSEALIPFTFGLLRPVIVIPESLAGPGRKRDMALHHELTHIKRGDAFLNTLLMLVRSVFWFVPLLNRLIHQLKIYREISCDQEVLRENQHSRKEYAELLFELALNANFRQRPLLGMSVEPSHLKKRIETMNTLKRQNQPFQKSLSLLIMTLFAVSLAMSCSDIHDMQAGDDEADLSAASGPDTDTSEDSGEKVVFTVVEDMPQMIGGLDAMYENLEYPETAKRAGIEGTVVVQFLIDEEGEVHDAQAIRGIGGGCDEAAVEAIRQVQFEPGRQRGRPVKVRFSIPVTFRLGEQDSPEASAEEPEIRNQEMDIRFLSGPENGTLTGMVYDKSEDRSMPGTNIVIASSTLGTTTDIEGNFILENIPSGRHELVFSYVGYETQVFSLEVD